MFTLHIKKKVKKPLYLSSAEDILEKSMTEILTNLKNSYSKDGNNIVYVTICQKALVNPIRSGTYHLQDNDLKGLVNHIMASLNRFLNSNKQVQLDDTFEIYFKVLSSDSINYPRHRRKIVPLRQLIGNGTGFKALLFGGLIDVPKTFPNKKHSLENMCLLSTVIFNTLKFQNPIKYKIIKEMCYAGKPNKILNKAGQLLYEEIQKFCTAVQIPMEGPHDYYTVIPLLSEFYKIQIHLIESMENMRKVSKISSPEIHDLERHRVYLFQNEPGHVVVIDNLKQFFTVNKRRICFDCSQFSQFAFKTITHRCHARINCDKCLGCFETKDTIKQQTRDEGQEITTFCDSKLKPELGLSCKKCSFTFTTIKCYSNHKASCDSNKLRIKCKKCDVYYLNNSKETYNIAQAKHVCGVWPKRCDICKQINSEAFHICKIRKENEHLTWPNLGFINMKFIENCSGNCQNCYLLKEDFMKTNQITFKELFAHKEFHTLNCDDHKVIGANTDKPNLISIITEEKNRFQFQQRTFTEIADFTKYRQPESCLVLPYCDNPMPMSLEVYKGKQAKKDMGPTFYKYLKKVSIENNCLDQLFQFLCDPNKGLSNYTFIVENNKVMFALLKYFLSLQVVPVIIQQETTITLLEITGLQIKFLLKSSYLKGSVFEVGLQYGVPLKQTFFPDVWNKEENYNYIGKKPNFESFQLFTDTLKEVTEKKIFYDELPNEWNFNEQIFHCFQNETVVSIKSVLKFLQEAFNLQKTLSLVTEKQPNAIHPFGGRIISLSGFSFALFQFYYYNDVEAYTVMNPDVNGRTQTSRGEFEYISWLNFKSGNFIQGSFNCPQGQKYFGRHSVDGYDAQTKTVYQFRG